MHNLIKLQGQRGQTWYSGLELRPKPRDWHELWLNGVPCSRLQRSCTTQAHLASTLLMTFAHGPEPKNMFWSLPKGTDFRGLRR